jgi:hypothetical protein
MGHSAYFFLADPAALLPPKNDADRLATHVIQHVRQQRPRVTANDLQLLHEWVLTIARHEWRNDESSGLCPSR